MICLLYLKRLVASSAIKFAPCKGIRNPANFCCWNPESTMVLESGIRRFGMESRRLESGIQRVGIQNPDAGRGWDPESRTFVDSLTWGE